MDELRAGDPREIGPYRTVARLGSGGMGRVYLARAGDGSRVAIKMIHAALARDPRFRERFAREVAAARRVSTPRTATVLDAEVEGATPWLATTFVEGPPLGAVLAAHGGLRAASLRALATGLVEGLRAVHAVGLVHRDVKPQNVLIAVDGPKIIDFGIAWQSDATALTRTGGLVGSPGYMSPEQLTGAPVGPESDVFALGALLVCAASGQGPFGTADPVALQFRTLHQEPDLDGVPPEFEPILRACLDRDPARRPGLAEIEAVFAAGAKEWPPVTLRGALISPLFIEVSKTDATPDAVPKTETATQAPAAPQTDGAVGGDGRAGGGHSRRRVLVGLGGLTAAAALGGTAWAALGGDDGPYLPRHIWTRRIPDFAASDHQVGLFGWNDVVFMLIGSALSAFDAATGRPRWSFAPGGAAASGQYGGLIVQPQVEQGRLFVVTTIEGGASNGLTALDAATGRQLWSSPLDESPTSVAYGGNVVVATTAMAATAHDAATGRLLWNSEKPGTPAVAANRVIFAADEVAVLDARTGQTQWTYTAAPAGGTQPPSTEFAHPLVTRSQIILPATDGSVLALDLATGAKRWTYAAGPAARPPALVDGGRLIYIAVADNVLGKADPGLTAVDAVTGVKVWHIPGDPQDTPVVSGGTVYFTVRGKVPLDTQVPPCTLYALDSGSGVSRWTAADCRTSAAPFGDLLFGYAKTGMKVLAAHTGKVLTTVLPGDGYFGRTLDGTSEASASEAAPPLVVDGRLFTLAKGGLLQGYELERHRKHAKAVTVVPAPSRSSTAAVPVAVKPLWTTQVQHMQGIGLLGTDIAVDVAAQASGTTIVGNVTVLSGADGRTLRQIKTSAAVLDVEGSGAHVYAADQSVVWAVDASGRRVWTAPTNQKKVSTGIAADAQTVVLAFDTNALRGFRASDGRAIWLYTAQTELGSAKVEGGLVLLDLAPHPVQALSAGSGRLLWTGQVGVPSNGAVRGGVVYLPDMNGRLYALDATSGRTLWTFSAQTPVRTVDVAADLCLLTCDEGLIAVDVKSGRRKWSFSPAAAPGLDALRVAGGLALAGARDGHFLYAVETSTGSPRWQAELGGAPADLQVTGTTAYVSTDREVSAIPLRAG